MESQLCSLLPVKRKPEWRVTFYAAMILGLAAHTYCFTNNLPCLDGLFNYYSSQDMLRSGRWLLSAACSFSSWFTLPWLIGLLSLVFTGLTAVVVTEIFQIRDKVLCILTAGLLVTFPAIASTFYFIFTADGYMAAMFLAALAVWLTPLGERRLWRYALAGLALCCSCGIYQAYVCFAMVLALCYLILRLLEGDFSQKELTFWIFAQLLTYILALACYYGIWQLILQLRNVSATSYGGISQVGNMGLQNITDAMVRSVRSFLEFFLERRSGSYLGSPWTILNILYLLLATVAALSALVRSGIARRKTHLVLLLAAVCLLPFAVHIWYFASPGSRYNIRMQQSMCILYIFVGVLCLRWLKPRGQLLGAAIMAIFVFFSSVNANVFYYHCERTFQKSYAAAIEISTRIHALDDGTQRFVVVEGDLIPQIVHRQKPSVQRTGFGPLQGPSENLLLGKNYVYLLLEHEVGFQLSYYQEHPEELPYMELIDGDPVGTDWTQRFPSASFDQLYHLRQDEQFQAMPSWPAAGSVDTIGDIVVVKLSDPSAE